MKGVPDMSRQLVVSRVEPELPHYATELPRWRSLLAAGAHPDDESFGLGAILAAFAANGTSLAVMSFTLGEASTLGAGERDLVIARAHELREAGRMLGVAVLKLLEYPDGTLADQALSCLVEDVRRVASAVKADGLLVFDKGGITGHPDHQRATEAALTAAELLDLPVLAWAIPTDVASRLNTIYDTGFAGRTYNEFDIGLRVDRTTQKRAIAKHGSQSTDNPVLWKRLELLGDHEWLRWLRPPVPSQTDIAGGAPRCATSSKQVSPSDVVGPSRQALSELQQHMFRVQPTHYSEGSGVILQLKRIDNSRNRMYDCVRSRS